MERRMELEEPKWVGAMKQNGNGHATQERAILYEILCPLRRLAYS
jgi:hypothetical protein